MAARELGFEVIKAAGAASVPAERR
jgi:hypothetical protein